MRLELRGVTQLLRMIERLTAAPRPDSRPLRDALVVVGESLVEKTAERFETQTDPYGTPWKPLAASTLLRNPRRAGGQILSDTARLRRSINAQVRHNSVAVGTSVIYAKFHQQPDRPGRKLPRRPFLPWRKEGGQILLPDDYLDEVRQTLGELWRAE